MSNDKPSERTRKTIQLPVRRSNRDRPTVNYDENLNNLEVDIQGFKIREIQIAVLNSLSASESWTEVPNSHSSHGQVRKQRTSSNSELQVDDDRNGTSTSTRSYSDVVKNTTTSSSTTAAIQVPTGSSTTTTSTTIKPVTREEIRENIARGKRQAGTKEAEGYWHAVIEDHEPKQKKQKATSSKKEFNDLKFNKVEKKRPSQVNDSHSGRSYADTDAAINSTTNKRSKLDREIPASVRGISDDHSTNHTSNSRDWQFMPINSTSSNELPNTTTTEVATTAAIQQVPSSTTTTTTSSNTRSQATRKCSTISTTSTSKAPKHTNLKRNSVNTMSSTKFASILSDHGESSTSKKKQKRNSNRTKAQRVKAAKDCGNDENMRKKN